MTLIIIMYYNQNSVELNLITVGFAFILLSRGTVLLTSVQVCNYTICAILINRVLLTYLLTPWSRVLLEKLTGLQLVKKFPEFFGTRRFITAHDDNKWCQKWRLKRLQRNK